MSAHVHQQVTNLIMGQLAVGQTENWTCPWHQTARGLPRNAITDRPYGGINVLALWSQAMKADYPDNRWASYRQWLQLGGQVRLGEKGSPCVFYKDLENDEDAREANPAKDRSRANERQSPRRFVLRNTLVFNAAQVDGLSNPDTSNTAPVTQPDPTPTFDTFVQRTGATIQPGQLACYVPATDIIRMPARDTFFTPEGYTATLAHELVHWTGAPHRLARPIKSGRNSQAYAAEELVAELGAAFVLASLGLASEPHPQHAAYLSHWLDMLKADPGALFTAGAHASRAADWLTGNRFPS